MNYTEADIKKWKEFYERANSDPAKTLYDSIVKASNQMLKLIDTNELDLITDNYQKSLFELLKQSKQIPMGMQAAKLEAYPELGEEEKVSLADRKR